MSINLPRVTIGTMMADDPLIQDAATATPPRPSLPMRVWLAIPDWAFRAAGAGFFFLYAFTRMRDYLTDFPNIGPYFYDAEGNYQYFPIAKILTDATFLLIAVSFAIRLPPRNRAMRAREIIIPVVAGFWPLAPFLAVPIVNLIQSNWAATLSRSFEFGPITPTRFYAGVILLSVGNTLDVWGYATLCRSLSIVAEARVLKTHGPYRLVRHPIYLGQFITQAAFWLILVRLQPIWVLFYFAFVTMQLYRSRLEDRVLENAFGDPYRAWKRRTFWFV